MLFSSLYILGWFTALDLHSGRLFIDGVLQLFDPGLAPKIIGLTIKRRASAGYPGNWFVWALVAMLVFLSNLAC